MRRCIAVVVTVLRTACGASAPAQPTPVAGHPRQHRSPGPHLLTLTGSNFRTPRTSRRARRSRSTTPPSGTVVPVPVWLARAGEDWVARDGVRLGQAAGALRRTAHRSCRVPAMPPARRPRSPGLTCRTASMRPPPRRSRARTGRGTDYVRRCRWTRGLVRCGARVAVQEPVIVTNPPPAIDLRCAAWVRCAGFRLGTARPCLPMAPMRLWSCWSGRCCRTVLR